MKNTLILLLHVAFLLSVPAHAQPPDYSQLDPAPYDPAVDPDIDLFITHWEQSMPRHAHGALILRDLLTPLEGDPLYPERPGAVLSWLTGLSYATMEAGTVTDTIVLSGEQKLVYVAAGTGVITTEGTTAALEKGVGVLIPPDVPTVISAGADETLAMYIATEPLTGGFEPNDDILVRNENIMPINYSSGHWANIHKQQFVPEDGFSMISGAGPVVYAPMTICQPHTHSEGNEEVWFALGGDIHILMGKQVRSLRPGNAFKNPPSGEHPYGPINVSDEPIKLYYIGAPRSQH